MLAVRCLSFMAAPYKVPRTNELLKRELAYLIEKEFNFGPNDIFVTIINVDTRDNLKTARVFIGVFPEDLANEALARLGQGSAFLKQRLKDKLKVNSLPDLVFDIQRDSTKNNPTEK